MSVLQIKEAIDHLPLEERAELNRLLYGWEDDAWDRQMQTDAAAGKFDKLTQQAEAEARTGQLRPLP